LNLRENREENKRNRTGDFSTGNAGFLLPGIQGMLGSGWKYIEYQPQLSCFRCFHAPQH
jgi:hypothetical protein